MMFRRKDLFACWQNNGSWSDFNEWMEAQWGGTVAYGKPGNPDITRTPAGELHVVTRRGQMTADVGDWMFKSTEGEILCVPFDVFEQMFEPVPTPEQLEIENLHLDNIAIDIAVWVCLSSAAVCWEDGAGGGEYQSGEVRRIGEQLLDRIKYEIRVQVEAALDAVAPLHANPDEVHVTPIDTRDDEKLIEAYGFDDMELKNAVFTALGAASMCWENPAGAGVFDSNRAEIIGVALMRRINDAGLVVPIHEREISDEVLVEAKQIVDRFEGGSIKQFDAVVALLKKVDRNARNWGVLHGRKMEEIASSDEVEERVKTLQDHAEKVVHGEPFPTVDDDIRKEM